MKHSALAPLLALSSLTALAACNSQAGEGSTAPDDQDSPAVSNDADIAPPPEQTADSATDKPELIPPAPGEEGGLPDDRTPLAEGPIAPDSAQGAAQVVQSYAAQLEEGHYGEAYRLWGHDGEDSEMSRQQFAASFDKYSEIHAMVGAPSDPEGAAGSIYVTVPLQLYGRLAEGGTFNMIGPVTLRRVNDVPGSTAQQRRWHIYTSELRPRGTVREAQ